MPVYNAAPYVRQAVESALMQPQVAEVVLVEDGSPDESLQICQQLASDYPQVKVYQHPGGENRGASASRNLAIQKSTKPYLAFLDADDTFLPDRFAETQQVFAEHPDCDGVYEGFHFFVEQTVDLPAWADNLREATYQRTLDPMPPEDVLHAFVFGLGYFSIIGLCVKRDLFDRTGLFDVGYRREDRIMTIKMAAVGRLYPGVMDRPVVHYRLHPHSRSITRKNSVSQQIRMDMLLWEVVWSWAQSQPDLNAGQRKLLLAGVIRQRALVYRTYPGVKEPSQLAYLIKLLHSKALLMSFLFWHPGFVLRRRFWFAMKDLRTPPYHRFT